VRRVQVDQGGAGQGVVTRQQAIDEAVRRTQPWITIKMTENYGTMVVCPYAAEGRTEGAYTVERPPFRISLLDETASEREPLVRLIRAKFRWLLVHQ
jgi:hypothetical protein